MSGYQEQKASVVPDTPSMGMSPRPWLALALVAACLFPIALDFTILYIAVPTLTAALGASDRQILWIADIFPLLMAGLVLVTGPLGDRLGHKRLLSWGLLVFGLASLAAALAPSAGALIAARALLAVGGAMIIPTTLALTRQLFADPRAQGIAIGAWGAVASAGAAAGPLVGGALLEHFHWSAVFLINLPLVALLLPLVLRGLANRPAARPPRWEPWSPLLGIVGIIGLVYALKAFAHPGQTPAIAAPAALVGLLALGLFVRRQLRQAQPLLDLRLFRHRRFRQGVLAAVLPTGVITGFELLLVQEIQFLRGLSPLQAGIFLLPLPLASLVAGPYGGHLVARLGPRAALTAALAVAALGYLGLAAGLPGTAQLCLALLGLGHGVVMAAATGAIMAAAPDDEAGGAATIESICFEVGGGLGIALFGSLMAWLYATFLALPDAGHSFGETLVLAAEVGGARGGELLAAARPAFAEAFQRVAVVGAAALLVTAALVLLPGRHRRRT